MEHDSALTLEEVNGILDELFEDYQRRQDQAILQQDLYKANYALAGKETCRHGPRNRGQKASVSMLTKGTFIVVFNHETIVAQADKLEQAIQRAEQHSVTTMRGVYTVYRLTPPLKKGQLGERIKWG